MKLLGCHFPLPFRRPICSNTCVRTLAPGGLPATVNQPERPLPDSQKKIFLQTIDNQRVGAPASRRLQWDQAWPAIRYHPGRPDR